jgi:hypothetical protein
VVIAVGSCTFLFLALGTASLLLHRILYIAVRDPSTTMGKKIGLSVYAIFFVMLEVSFIRVWLPMSDYTYLAIVPMAFVLKTLVVLRLDRWLDANRETIKNLVAEAMAQRRERRALKKSND